MNVQRLSHIGICVSELERSVAFYRDALGFEEISRLRVSGQRRAKKIVRFELAYRLPQRRQQFIGGGAASLHKGFAAGFAEQFELNLPQPCGCLLFREAQAGGFHAGPGMMSGPAIGADNQSALQFDAKLATPAFERACRHKFEIIEMRVNAKNFHELD